MAWDSQRPIYRFARVVADDAEVLSTLVANHQLGDRVAWKGDPDDDRTWEQVLSDAAVALDEFARLMDDCTT
ncbi:MAG: hypothetical protein KJO40_18250 [Deltaproteobacteria bacterium]|nr:hypothetical protein [Deltaproteobacteria bacterium]